MSVYILKNKPVAFIKDINTLVATDFHIGFELDLRERGIKIPSQSEKFIKILEEARTETGANRLILLGDIKHKVPRATSKEVSEVKNFIKKLSDVFKVVVCKGNHDDRIEDIVDPSVKVYGARGLKIKDYGFFHGHAWPFTKLWNAKTWIVGHLQALIKLKFGNVVETKRVVIKGRPRIKKGKIEDIIILPAFNELLGGLVLNDRKNQFTGFLFEKILDHKSSRVYLLDGTEVGNLRDLMTQ
ncbi:MAG: metallophosphoesterase [Candidatus Aenigmarchaeota archaeon]|nr:metallophosphoesterase [Candidatus Aenigmarchaeota archaeon]MDW8160380.1 metallophosphoesterase [Candidatus Aenigmarchaeota archaeon]